MPVTSPIRSDLGWFLGQCRPRRLRTMREFAESEIVIPAGPFAGRRFRCHRQPFVGLWFDEVDRGPWTRFVATGPTQSGKTLACFVIPLLYHLFELNETVICGLPDMDMAADKWREDLLPVIERSRYWKWLPTRGDGSRGGKVQGIQFTNGATLRFMSGGGSDKSRAGFTSRVVVITETDGLDQAGGTSRETDKISQLQARTHAFGDRARVYMECTVSTEEGRTWREIKSGSDSRIVLPCPYCQAWVTPDRDRLVGWQEARHVVEAGTLARLRCSACGEAWSDAERVEANRRGKLLHKGQAIGTDGVVTGEVSSTRTLGFRFTAVNNLLMGMHRVAEEEWEAPRTIDPELAEKKLRQFFWALPSATESVTLSEIDAMAIAGRSIAVPRGRVPKGTVAITLGVDIGKWLCHWVAVAWVERDGNGEAGGSGGGGGGGTPHVVEYGRLEVASNQMAEELAIQTALRRFRDEVALVGWPSVDGPMVPASLLLVDAGNWESAVVSFCLETGHGCLPTKGFGVQQLGRRSILQEPGYESVRQPQGYQLVEINADHWKSFVHARLQTPVGQLGGLTLFHGTAQEHLTFAKHLTAEKRVEEFVAGKGLVSRWEAINRNNHFLDALALACVAGYGIGIRLGESIRVEEPSERTSTPVMTSNPLTSWRGRW